jgi:hypothetical protein
LADEGVPFSCGLAIHGQLGHAKEKLTEGQRLLLAPQAVNQFSHGKAKPASAIKITQVAAGIFHSLFLSENGTVYSCGTDTHGQMGLSAGLKGVANKTVYLPSIIKQISMYKVQKLAAGHFHSIYFTTSGDIWTCGQSNFGSLGEGKVSRLPIPGIDFEKQEILGSSQNRQNIIKSVSVSGSASSFDTALGHSYVLAPTKEMTVKEIDEAVSFTNFSDSQFLTSLDQCIGTWIHPNVSSRCEIPATQVIRLAEHESLDPSTLEMARSGDLQNVLYFITPVSCLPQETVRSC